MATLPYQNWVNEHQKLLDEAILKEWAITNLQTLFDQLNEQNGKDTVHNLILKIFEQVVANDEGYNPNQVKASSPDESKSPTEEEDPLEESAKGHNQRNHWNSVDVEVEQPRLHEDVVLILNELDQTCTLEDNLATILAHEKADQLIPILYSEPLPPIYEMDLRPIKISKYISCESLQKSIIASRLVNGEEIPPDVQKALLLKAAQKDNEDFSDDDDGAPVAYAPTKKTEKQRLEERSYIVHAQVMKRQLLDITLTPTTDPDRDAIVLESILSRKATYKEVIVSAKASIDLIDDLDPTWNGKVTYQELVEAAEPLLNEEITYEEAVEKTVKAVVSSMLKRPVNADAPYPQILQGVKTMMFQDQQGDSIEKQVKDIFNDEKYRKYVEQKNSMVQFEIFTQNERTQANEIFGKMNFEAKEFSEFLGDIDLSDNHVFKLIQRVIDTAGKIHLEKLENEAAAANIVSKTKDKEELELSETKDKEELELSEPSLSSETNDRSQFLGMMARLEARNARLKEKARLEDEEMETLGRGNSEESEDMLDLNKAMPNSVKRESSEEKELKFAMKRSIEDMRQNSLKRETSEERDFRVAKKRSIEDMRQNSLKRETSEERDIRVATKRSIEESGNSEKGKEKMPLMQNPDSSQASTSTSQATTSTRPYGSISLSATGSTLPGEAWVLLLLGLIFGLWKMNKEKGEGD